MTVRMRQMLYFLFLFGFLVTAPTLVLYTAGYRINVRTGKISQTGVLSVGTIPKGATVFVDGVRMSERTPAILEDMLQGQHAIRVEKDGYNPWEKTLTVTASTTTFATEIALFLVDDAELVFSASPTSVSVEPLSERVAYTIEEAGTREVWVYDPAEASKTLVSRLPMSEPQTRAWAPNVDSRLFVTESETNQTIVARMNGQASEIVAYVPLGTYTFESAPDDLILLYDAGHSRLVLLDDTGIGEPILLTAEATEWTWHPEKPSLLYSNGFDLHIYDTDAHTDETITRVSDPITGLAFDPVAAAILYTQNTALVGMELDGRDHRNVETLGVGSALQSVWVDERGRYAYFFGTIGDETGLWKRQLQK